MVTSCKSIEQCRNQDTHIDTVKIQNISTTTGIPHAALLFFFNILFIRERERKDKQGERQAEGEGDSPLSKEHYAGLDGRVLES